MTSTLTLLEVLVKPLRLNRTDLVDQYENILTLSPNIDMFDMDIVISKQAARLRAKYNLRTPDSIQLATGIINKANFFLTNDTDLKRVVEIEVITLKSL